MLGKVTDTLIECTDLAGMRRYYSEVLGFEVTDAGEGWVTLRSGDHEIVLWQGRRSEVVLGLTGADLGQARELLETRGAAPGPEEEHPGGRHFYLADPEGNRIMIGDT